MSKLTQVDESFEKACNASRSRVAGREDLLLRSDYRARFQNDYDDHEIL
jgi:hypothetical protein